MVDLKQPSRKSRVTFGPRKELYDYLKDQPYGFEISYAKLTAILGRDPQGEARADILAVRDWLIDDFGKYLECSNGKGYFIARAAENRDIANRYGAQAFKRIKTAMRIFSRTDTAELHADELRAHIEDGKRNAIKYLVMAKVNKAKEIDGEPIAIPSGRELLEIYKRGR